MSVTMRELIKTGAISSKDATIAGFIAIGLVVLLVLYIAVIDAGMKRHRDELNESVRMKMDDLEAAQSLAAREVELENELREIDEIVRKFEAKLPTRKELPRLYREFQEAAGQAGVKVEGIKKLDEGGGATLVTIPYSFSVSGAYHQLGTFLNMLECGDRFMKVSKLHIGEQENGVSTAEFTLSTYLFKEKGG